MSKSRQDHDLESFEIASDQRSARRVLVKNASLPVVPIDGLVLPKYNRGHGEKPTSTQEVYTYFLDDVLVATLTVDYEDETKKFVVDWELVLP